MIINWMKYDVVRNGNGNKNIIGRKKVRFIEEVMFDLDNPLPKNKLKCGISLIIRAKNEELNLKYCIESVVDLVDEIIFIDNNSTDKTYEIMQEYAKIYDKIKLYQYCINVSRVGVQHASAIARKDPNTLGNFYNWSLSKATYNNVFKWDADFICIRNNFKNLVDIYNLRERTDRFAIWFTGYTLFENNNDYYINFDSFYNEYRIFSYKNNFKWYDGDTCEYTEPYLNTCLNDKKYTYEYPLFYELKRTSIDEFGERSSLIDIRDINDFNILNNLKENKVNNLVKVNYSLINDLDKNIIIYTPSLSFGGGNQFITNIYKIYKSIGFNIIVVPLRNDTIGKDKFKSILESDIIDISKFNLDFIRNFKADYIFFNSDIFFSNRNLYEISMITKIIFITHSDVAYSNSFVEKYYSYFYKILTVNDYTIEKLTRLLNIDDNEYGNKFYKIINYTDINLNSNKNNISNVMDRGKSRKFGVITRFSDDKNMPMLIFALVMIFKKYPNYTCYFVGTQDDIYDKYLKELCKKYEISNNVSFEGFQTDVSKYYDIFDFIILPSVSEGCSYNIIEALGCGVPVIASDVGGNHELIKHGENGFLIPYGGIREYEKKTVFIHNYNEQLSLIGYFINDDQFRASFGTTYGHLNAIPAPFVVCNKGNHKGKCLGCDNIKNRLMRFNENVGQIYGAIFNMIELKEDEIKNIKMRNINFIKTNFNKNRYINQLFEIIGD